jgi:hypothetical protein
MTTPIPCALLYGLPTESLSSIPAGRFWKNSEDRVGGRACDVPACPAPQQFGTARFIGPARLRPHRLHGRHAPLTGQVAHFFTKKKTEGLDTDKIAFYILQNVKCVTRVGPVDDGPIMDKTMVGMGSHQSERPVRERGSGPRERRWSMWSGSGRGRNTSR